MSPVPPGLSANAVFLAAATIASALSHSARVILPSLFASIVSKKPLSTPAVISFLASAPSPLLSPISNKSNGGSLKLVSSAAPGDQAAKYRSPSEVTGDARVAVGMPVTNHFSSPF